MLSNSIHKVFYNSLAFEHVMRITLDITKSLEENAATYYEIVKKLKKKSEHARAVVEEIKRRMLHLRQHEEKPKKIIRKKEWYEKFHWFFTSTGFFVLGGRDATTNELIIKKHTEKHDLVFHTELSGSPFFVLKTEGKTPDDVSIMEAATATACYSRAWKMGRSMAEVFFVMPEQVSKTTETGEYISKGSFVIRGRKEHRLITEFTIALGKKEGCVVGGPVPSIAVATKEFITVRQGKEKQSDIAKKIAKRLDVDSNEVVPFLPAGGLSLK